MNGDTLHELEIPLSIVSPDWNIIDRAIKEDIENLTAENSDIWNGSNFDRSEYTHSFFQYPAMMIPVVQKSIIGVIKNNRPDTNNMLDPFMGSATSIIASMEFGLNCYGQDINPLAILIAKTRTGPYQWKSLESKIEVLLTNIKADESILGDVSFNNINKWFKEDVIIELSKIRKAIKQFPSIHVRRFFWVNLAETVRLVSNDRTSTFKLHQRPKDVVKLRNPKVINVFETVLKRSLKDLKLYYTFLSDLKQLDKGFYKSDIIINIHDSSKSIYSPTQTPFYDILVSSPPYGDNSTTITYGEHSYLPLQWINFDDIDPLANLSLLKTTQEIDSLSLGGRTSKVAKTDIDFLSYISPTFREIWEALETKNKDGRKRVSRFIFDFNKTLSKIVSVMKANSYFVWTIGNRNVRGIEIQNNQILKELMFHHGCVEVTRITRDIMNKRMAKKNPHANLMTKEDIIIFRKSE